MMELVARCYDTLDISMSGGVTNLSLYRPLKSKETWRYSFPAWIADSQMGHHRGPNHRTQTSRSTANLDSHTFVRLSQSWREGSRSGRILWALLEVTDAIHGPFRPPRAGRSSLRCPEYLEDEQR